MNDTNLLSGKTPIPVSEARQRLTELLAGLHLITVDLETTGLGPHDRVIQYALVNTTGAVLSTIESHLVNPRLSRIQTTHIHGYTAADLATEPLFEDQEPAITALLTSDDEHTSVLIGHNVAFDAGRLAYEYRLAGVELPRFRLLDTGDLARAVGLRPKSRKLSALLETLSITNTAPHTAFGDALATAQAAIQMLNTLATYQVGTIEPLLTEPHSRRHQSRDDVELTPAHQEVHGNLDLGGTKTERNAALDYCLAHLCDELADRAESFISNATVAASIEDWALNHLRDNTLSRAQAGLACAVLGRSVRHLNHAEANIVKHYQLAVPELDTWGTCDPDVNGDDICDACAKGVRSCRFVRIRWSYVSAYLRDNDGNITYPRTVKFLPVRNPDADKKKPPVKSPTKGWFQVLVATGDTQAAAFGAVKVAEMRRRVRTGRWALDTTTLAWNAGLRSASLAYLHSRLIEEVDGGTPNTLTAALAVCQDALDMGQGPDRYEWERLVQRHQRLNQRINAPATPSVEKPRNRRPSARNRFRLS